jgi:hypothetical protein
MKKLVVILAALSAACGGGSSTSHEPVVRDSAGVRIVENSGPAWTDASQWRLSAEPVLRIGESEAEPEYQLFGVRGVSRLSDGRIVLPNTGTQEIRWYSSDGSHLVTAGGQGEGPGEFTGLGWLGVLVGDSIITYDQRQRRLSLFDPAGMFVRSSLIEIDRWAAMQYPVFSAVLSDGSLLATGRLIDQQNMAEGPMLVPMAIYRYTQGGEGIDSLFDVPRWEATVVIRRSDQIVQMAVAGRPFGRSTRIGGAGNRIFIGTPSTFEIRVHGLEGTMLSILRVLRPLEPLTAGEIDAYKQRQLELVEGDEALQTRRRELEELDYPSTKPAFGGVLAEDTHGNLWVQGFTATGEEAVQWTVFDREYRMLGTVETPPRFAVSWIGDDLVLGIWRDEFDVEYVLGYALIKP